MVSRTLAVVDGPIRALTGCAGTDAALVVRRGRGRDFGAVRALVLGHFRAGALKAEESIARSVGLASGNWARGAVVDWRGGAAARGAEVTFARVRGGIALAAVVDGSGNALKALARVDQQKSCKKTTHTNTHRSSSYTWHWGCEQPLFVAGPQGVPVGRGTSVQTP